MPRTTARRHMAVFAALAVLAATVVDLDAQRGGRGGGAPGGGARGGDRGAGPGRGGVGRGLPPDPVERPRPAQDDGEIPTFRTGVAVVQIDAIVTDAAGRPVATLTADDFEVLESGQPREIVAFAAVDIPLPSPEPDTGAAESDVAANTGPPGRTYLIALDEVAPDRALRARALLRQFIQSSLGPDDRAAIALTGRGLANSGQDFTNNRRLLLDAVDRFSGAFESPPEGRPSSSSGPQLAASLRSLTEFLATMPGRKILIVVAEALGGLDPYAATDYRGGALTPAERDTHAAIAAATRGNVTIYPIDPRGLTTDTTEAESFDTTNLDARADLAALADVTGGFAVIGNNNIGTLLEQLVHENSVYYTIGFGSRDDRTDGRFVPVEVRVTRPGLYVRARNGYVAPLERGRAARQVEADTRNPIVADAIASPVAVNAVPMRVAAASYRAGGRNASVVLAVEFDLSALDLVAQDGRQTGQVEVTYLTTDASGRVRPGRRHAATVTVESRDAAERWARAVSEFELPRGRYQVRIAAGSATRAGSVVYDLEVPDFGNAPLTLSQVSLTTTAAQGLPTLRMRDPLSDVLPGPPIAGREFRAEEMLALYVEAYQNGRRPDAAPRITITLRRPDGTIVRTPPGPQTSSPLRDGSAGRGLTAMLPLEGLSPGPYVLHVEARVDGTGDVATRAIPLRIR